MDLTLIVGILMLVGYVFGELARKVGLPKVTGYILAGVCLNPRLVPIVHPDFLGQTSLFTNIALAFITFSVGGTLRYSRIRALGRTILTITVFEAEFAMLAVVGGMVAFGLLLPAAGAGGGAAVVALAILLGALASPTDPSATLAVAHDYNAHGKVTSTIMGVAAFDDVTGIINYSLAVAIASALLAGGDFSLYGSLLLPVLAILGGVAVGIAFGVAFNFVTWLVKRETQGALIVLIFAMLPICFGVARLARCDELLATMSMGMIVVNFNPKQETIFRMLERYTEELIFVLFFTLSGMQLDFAALGGAWGMVLVFVVLRAAGKFSGTALAAHLSHAPAKVKRYTALGLLPQGGIVVGLALLMKTNPAFHGFADLLISIVIGATVIHELAGPIVAELALKKAGEIHRASSPSET